MKALIFKNKVMEIAEVSFEVHSDLYWVDCDSSVEIGDGYKGKTFISSAPTKEEIQIAETKRKLAEAKAYLSSTDFKMALDYDQDVTDVKIKRQEARDFIRNNEENV